MANTSFSEREIQLMIAMMADSASQGIKYNWESVAAATTYPNGHAASCAWYRVQNKLKAAAGSINANANKGKSTGEDVAGKDGDGPAAKKRKRAPGKAKKAELKDEPVDEGMQEEETAI